MKRFALTLFMVLALTRMAAAACTTTINLGLQICDFAEPSWDVQTNANWNKLDLSFASPLSRSGVAVTLGTVPYTKGGTGIVTYAKGDLLAGITSGALAVLPVGTNGYALIADSTQTTGYKFASVASPPYSDALAFLLDDTDGTKKLRFELGGFTTATTRVLTPQNRDGTIADLALNVFLDHQTLDNQKALRLREATAGGTNYTGFRAPAALAGNVIYDLPDVDGAAEQVLSTDGGEVLSWVDGAKTQTTANGATRVRTVASELITLSTGGATTDSSADLLPADSLIEAVGCRVTTTITTATDWSVGDPTTAARFSSANATLTAGTTSVGLNHMKGAVATDAAGPTQASADKLRITTTGTPGAGEIRCDVWYTHFTAPTS